MTSVNTNAAANTALRTLQATNRSLEITQNRISTGLKIGEAKDNAAYWSISTTLKSDNKALSTVKDALGLGAATVDTAYTALNSTIDVLNEIKSKLTAATQSGVDRDVIQSEIAELQKQLKSIADSATFSGENWLSVNSATPGFASTKTVVASFNRDANGAATIGTIDIDITNVKLYDSNGTTGLIDGDQNATGFALAAAGTTTANAADLVFAADSSAILNVTQNGVTKQITLDQALAVSIGLTGGVINSGSELESLINAGLSKAGITNVAASITAGGAVSFSSSSAFTVALGAVTAGAGTGITAADLGLGGTLGAGVAGSTITTKAVADIDISKTTLDALGVDTAAEIKLQLESYISIVNKTLKSVTSAASSLGSVGSRIELQSTFVTSLLDTIDEGVGNLIDADLNEESTRLQALQVKQQLGVQALGIANQSSQNILSLFQ